MPDLLAAQFEILFHIHGPAIDVAARLRALQDGDDEAFGKALSDLSGALMHQGTPTPATAPAALFIADMLLEDRTAGPEQAYRRAELLSFLSDVAEGLLLYEDAVGQVPAHVLRLLTSGFDVRFLSEVRRVAEEHCDGDLREGWGWLIETDDDWATAHFWWGVLTCYRVVPVLLERARHCMEDVDEAVKRAAAKTEYLLTEASRVQLPCLGA